MRSGRAWKGPAFGSGQDKGRWRRTGAKSNGGNLGGLRLAGPDVGRGDGTLWTSTLSGRLPSGQWAMGSPDAQGGPRRDLWSAGAFGDWAAWKEPSVAVGLDSGLGPTTECWMAWRGSEQRTPRRSTGLHRALMGQWWRDGRLGGMGPRQGSHGVALGQWTVSRAMGLGKPRWRNGGAGVRGGARLHFRWVGGGAVSCDRGRHSGSPWPGTAPDHLGGTRANGGQRARGRSAALLDWTLGVEWGGSRGFALAAVARGGSVDHPREEVE